MATTAVIDIHNPADVHVNCGPMISGPKCTLELSDGAEPGADRIQRNVRVVIYGTLEELAALALRIDGAVVEARDRAAVPAAVVDNAKAALP